MLRRGITQRLLSLLLLVLLPALLLSGCGKKGPLIPPEALAPAQIVDLAVAQKGGRFQVSWSSPLREESGQRLTDLAGFLLFRRPVLPPSQDCEECPSAYTQLAKVYVDYPKEVTKVGNRYLYADTDLLEGKTYQYKVRSFTAEELQSKDSNKVRRTAVHPAAPPVLEAESTATGVVLSFVSIPPSDGAIVGYNIYRAKAGEKMPPSPLNATPVSGTKYEDKSVLFGARYSYWMTTLEKVKNETLESDPSNEVSGEMQERE
ncbi:LPS translocon maturation chaperone LptM [Geomonas sp.]|uniref:LPS translocon maturation chaperone LptM n=1 Tax=Geomonas sp. TaxID=2651584 RepID=UPI002B49975D|nr:fibronectin type III domain-containing protein [Geomonas sp.]HJV34404.1 fibronectin type III domain-containing protein [Geomonas sp.]